MSPVYIANLNWFKLCLLKLVIGDYVIHFLIHIRMWIIIRIKVD